MVSERKLLIHSQITHQLTRETATKILTMRRQKKPKKPLLLKNKLCSSVAWLVRIQLFHLSFRFLFPLALFTRSFSLSPSPLGVNFLLLSKGMGTGRGSDAPPVRCGGISPLQTALNTAEDSQESYSALCSMILLLFQEWGRF